MHKNNRLTRNRFITNVGGRRSIYVRMRQRDLDDIAESSDRISINGTVKKSPYQFGDSMFVTTFFISTRINYFR